MLRERQVEKDATSTTLDATTSTPTTAPEPPEFEMIPAQEPVQGGGEQATSSTTPNPDDQSMIDGSRLLMDVDYNPLSALEVKINNLEMTPSSVDEAT